MRQHLLHRIERALEIKVEGLFEQGIVDFEEFGRLIAAPAELKRNCTLPKPSIASWIISLTASRLVTSIVSAKAWLPIVLICSAVSLTPLSLMSAHTTLAFSRAKMRAVARPIPLAAPVIMMVFPEK